MTKLQKEEAKLLFSILNFKDKNGESYLEKAERMLKDGKANNQH